MNFKGPASVWVGQFEVWCAYFTGLSFSKGRFSQSIFSKRNLGLHRPPFKNWFLGFQTLYLAHNTRCFAISSRKAARNHLEWPKIGEEVNRAYFAGSYFDFHTHYILHFCSGSTFDALDLFGYFALIIATTSQLYRYLYAVCRLEFTSWMSAFEVYDGLGIIPNYFVHY